MSSFSKNKKDLEQFKRWKARSCAGVVAPTFLDCWSAATLAQRKTVRRLEAEICDALIARDNAFRRENETANYAAAKIARHIKIKEQFVARVEEMREVLRDITETLQKLTEEK